MNHLHLSYILFWNFYLKLRLHPIRLVPYSWLLDSRSSSFSNQDNLLKWKNLFIFCKYKIIIALLSVHFKNMNNRKMWKSLYKCNRFTRRWDLPVQVFSQLQITWDCAPVISSRRTLSQKNVLYLVSKDTITFTVSCISLLQISFIRVNNRNDESSNHFLFP